MNKLKRLTLKMTAWKLVALVVGVVAIGGAFVRAFSTGGSPKVVVEGDYIEAPQKVQDVITETMQPTLGAVSEYDAQLQTHDGDQVYHIAVPFLDATTTLGWIATPFLAPTSSNNEVIVKALDDGVYGLRGVTTTVEMVRLTITGASTSTAENVFCGSTDDPFYDPVQNIVFTNALVTSTIGVVENGTASSTYAGALPGGQVQKIYLTPQRPYLVCKVKAVMAGGFTGANNTFAGKITVRMSRQR